MVILLAIAGVAGGLLIAIGIDNNRYLDDKQFAVTWGVTGFVVFLISLGMVAGVQTCISAHSGPEPSIPAQTAVIGDTVVEEGATESPPLEPAPASTSLVEKFEFGNQRIAPGSFGGEK